MSITPRRCLGLALIALAGLLLAGPPAAQAQKSDLIDQVKRTNEIAAQKMEADVKDALVDAQKNAVSDPAGVVDRLKRVLGRLEADRALTSARRDLLSRQLKDRIKTAETEADRVARKTGETNQKLAGGDIRAKEAEQRAAEQQRIQRTLEYVGALQKEGKTGEASKVAEDLFRRHPNLAAPQAIGRTSSALDQVTALRSMKGEAEGRRLAALTSLDRQALAPGSDMDFPKDWASKIKTRQPINQSYLSAKEKEILKALSTPITVDFKNAGFMEVIEYLSTTLKQPILLDKASLADLGVSSETQVSFSVKGLTARTVLRRILGDVGLAYIVKGEAIEVVSEKVAKETMVTRTYFLGNLLSGGTFSDAGIRFVPGLSQFEAMQNVLSIVNLIQSSVEPSSWQANGGQGTITFHAPTMSLIIRNSAEVHGMMGGYLR
jgi:hypothetical protein